MRLIEQRPERWDASFDGWKPVPESIIPLLRSGRRNWGAWSDERLLAHAKWAVAQYAAGGRWGLAVADSGLYDALRRRKLLDKVGLTNSHSDRRNWAAMENEELLAFARRSIARNGIAGRTELANTNRGLYQILIKRGLVGEVGLGSIQDDTRKWAAMTKEEMVAFAKKSIAELGVTGRTELAKADEGMYRALKRRKLLGEVGLGSRYRNWSLVGDKELIAHARKFIEERGVGSRKELFGADAGLYCALRSRKLLAAVFARIESSKHADAVDGVLDALDSFGDGK